MYLLDHIVFIPNFNLQFQGLWKDFQKTYYASPVEKSQISFVWNILFDEIFLGGGDKKEGWEILRGRGG